jgi:pimeloyl-ACP methyl ester carboxylesterase
MGTSRARVPPVTMRRAVAVGVIGLVAGIAVFARPGVVRAPHPAPSISLRECDALPNARCGTLDVFEDRRGTKGRKISINVVVLPALEGRMGEPVFWLEGGPGGAATSAIGPVSQQYLRSFRDHHDLVFVDQRGTGGSHPLNCGDIGDSPANVDAYFGRLFPLELVRACREMLERIADLRYYTTDLAMDDLDDVRRALGYDRINLAGASYGTIAAQVYMRQHPDRVRAAFLTGVATPAFKLPLPFARASQHAWDRVVTDCAREAACHSAFPKLTDELSAVLARFEAGPLQVQVTDPATQNQRTVTLEREAFVERLRGMLYSTNGARVVPLVVHQAYLGDFLTFQAMAARFRPGGAISRGAYFSVTCSETVPFITEAEIVAETRGSFLGDRRTRAHMAACGQWVRAGVDPSFLAPVKSDAPTIMFSGDVDGATPPWVAEQAIGGFANGRLIKAPNTGHQIPGPCAWDLMQAFFSKPTASELEATCVSELRRPPFAIVREG